MSAYIVSPAHLHAIVQTAIEGPTDVASDVWLHHGTLKWFYQGKWGELLRAPLAYTREAPCFQEVVKLLLAENVRSVKYRYEDEFPRLFGRHTPLPYYTVPRRSQRVRIVQAFKLIDCLDYQCCEPPDWEQSEAFCFLQALRKHLWQNLPGYEDAAWHLDTAA